MKRFLRKNFVILALVLAGFSVFVVPRIFFRSPSEGQKAEKGYYCPMHPTYTSDRPGDCPICNMKLVPLTPKGGEGGVRGETKKERKILYYRHPMGQPDISQVPKKDSMGMDYIPVYDDEVMGQTSQVPSHAVVEIPFEKQQLIGVKLGTVERRALAKEIRTTGRVAFDPELFTAQQEFLSSVDALKRAGGGPYHEPLERTRALMEAARTRLRLLGMTESEINELEQKAAQDRNLILPEGPSVPFSSAEKFVWVYGTVYEYELPFVKVGTSVKVRVPTLPDQAFTGEVRAIDPVLDPTTRSSRARIFVRDPGSLLKPEMYVDVLIEPEMGEVLSVPVEAVMQTGERAIVFVVQGEGRFEPREVQVGAQAGDFYEVKSGLRAGEKVVVSGNFLIDSESRLQSAFQGMGEGGGHQHGA